jgi:hypothetical protein
MYLPHSPKSKAVWWRDMNISSLQHNEGKKKTKQAAHVSKL